MSFCRKKKEYQLTPTQELLLALLRAQLWLNPVDDIVLPSTIEQWDDLLNLAYKQTVVCFIAAACLRHKDVANIPQDIREELEAVIEENKKIHEYHNDVLVELITKFEEQGLHPILLKGQGIAQMYDCVEPDSSFCIQGSSFQKNSLLRQCGDIDLYFSPAEYTYAKTLMQKLEDNSNVAHDTYKHYETTYHQVLVELHFVYDILPQKTLNNKFQNFSQERAVEPSKILIKGKEININKPDFNFLFTVIHTIQHFEKESVSLRQICDIMIMLYYYKEMNCLDMFCNILREYKLSRFCKILVSLIDYHLGLKVSINRKQVVFEKKGVFNLLKPVFEKGAIPFRKRKQIIHGHGLSFYPRKVINFIDSCMYHFKMYCVCGEFHIAYHKKSLVRMINRNFGFVIK